SSLSGPDHSDARSRKNLKMLRKRNLALKEEGSLKIMHSTSVEGVDDMIKLGDMTEAALLRNLMLRHKRGHIYVSHALTEKNITAFPFGCKV
ncbi:hypothetical protein XENOCAPTIV_015399, partial [Xenoophorus captivus]